MLFRSLVLGLLLAVIVLVMERPTIIATPAPCEDLAPGAGEDTLRVIDVVSARSPSWLLNLVPMSPGESITSVDDHAVVDDDDTRARMWLGARTHDYIDVTITRSTDAHERRVLLLVH